MPDQRPNPSLMTGVIPYLSLAGRAAESLEFYARAFGAAELDRMPDPAQPDRLMHCTTVIHGRALMMTDFVDGDAAPARNFGHLQLVVADGRGWWDRAVHAGCGIIDPFQRQFWGDDFGVVQDPFGFKWAILQPAEALAEAALPLPEPAHDLTLRRRIAAPRAVVWRCWTEPDLLRQWFCPKPWTVSEAEFDLRPGGRMNTVMSGPAGERVAGQGIWLLVEPLRRLVFTDAFTEGFVPVAEPFMTGEVVLEDLPDGATALTWSARHATAAATERHRAMGWEAGWNAAADQLDALARTIAARQEHHTA